MHSSSEAWPWSARRGSRASRVRRFVLAVLCLIGGADCQRGRLDQRAAVQARSSHKSDCESSSRVGEFAHEALERNGDPALRSIVSLLSVPIAETRAIVAARFDGCGGQPVSEVRLEAWHPRRDGYHYCSACRAIYPDASGSPDPGLTRFASRSETAAWMLAPPRATTFIARDFRSGQPVSVFGPVELPLGVTRLVLTRASSEQLAMLSDEMRNGQHPPRGSSTR